MPPGARSRKMGNAMRAVGYACVRPDLRILRGPFFTFSLDEGERCDREVWSRAVPVSRSTGCNGSRPFGCLAVPLRRLSTSGKHFAVKTTKRQQTMSHKPMPMQVDELAKPFGAVTNWRLALVRAGQNRDQVTESHLGPHLNVGIARTAISESHDDNVRDNSAQLPDVGGVRLPWREIPCWARSSAR